MKKKILTLLIASSLLASSLFAADATAVDSKTTQQQTQGKVDMGADVTNLNNAISSDSKPIATTTLIKIISEIGMIMLVLRLVQHLLIKQIRTMLIVCSLHLRKY